MRLLPCLALAAALADSGAARADEDFIATPIPETATPTPAPASDPAREIERAGRGVRQRLDERGLEQKGSRAAVEAYRAREQRARDVEALEEARARRVEPSSGDTERVRVDIDRAREKLELERRLDRIEPTRP